MRGPAIRGDGGKEMSAEKKGAVGVIGLGIMGSAMAANLVKSGFEVIGTDIAAQCRDATSMRYI